MNLETFRWPAPIDSSDSENSEELLERERADQIMEERETAEMEKTAELVAEQEKREEEKNSHRQPKSDKKVYPKAQVQAYRTKETGTKTDSKPVENPAKFNQCKEEDGENDRPYSDIYPYSRNLNRR
ncbi:MAG: hypothetical protein WC719_00195 [Patescibacteria group bacterium]|jgi:hypothetical protein